MMRLIPGILYSNRVKYQARLPTGHKIQRRRQEHEGSERDTPAYSSSHFN
jgi:hypothetical protein